MKKKIMMIAMSMLLAFAVAGCGAKNTDDAPKVEVTDGAELLNKVWDTYGEDQKFPAMGGDFNNPVDNAAGAFDIADAENLTYMLYIPADSVELIDGAASLIHAMNTNTFTGAAFHLADASKAQTLADSLKENISNTQWMCGFPDKLVIFSVNGGEYVVSAFGNGEIMDNFKTKLTEVYGESAVLLIEENLV